MDHICTNESVFNTSIALSPPLVTQVDSRDNASGLLVKILNEVMNKCCGGNATLDIKRLVSSPQELYSGITDDEQIVLPYYDSGIFRYRIENTSFLPVISSPGQCMHIYYVNYYYY